MRRLTDGRWRLARRAGLAAALALIVAGCGRPPVAPSMAALPAAPMMYSAVVDDGIPVPAVAISRIEPQYHRQVVPTPWTISAEPGTIVVDPGNRFLYLVNADGTSLRYGIGVGREGFGWSGEALIKDKQHWPKWFPPKEMVERDPRAAPYADGMDGGLNNPLGARALYLWQGGKDTLYRLHGTNDPASIGRAVSSGCVRLLNQDAIDLYERVPLGAKVVVLPSTEGFPIAAVVGQLFPPATTTQSTAPLVPRKPIPVIERQ